MSRNRMLIGATLSLATLACLGIYACDNSPRPSTTAPAMMMPHSAQTVSGGSINAELAALRAMTAPFHELDKGAAAGWSTQITPCLSSPAGAMGFHYGNVAYIDGEVDLMKPELLLYEPQAGGHMRLVGLEYIVPLSAWTHAEPPSLLGQQFHVNSTFGVWALHIWLWRDNPAGLFADWNPKVSCDNAS